MTDITIFKPATVVVKALGGGKYAIDKPPSMTISAINGMPPVNQTALVAELTARIEVLTRELEECRSAAAVFRGSSGQGWPVKRG